MGQNRSNREVAKLFTRGEEAESHTGTLFSVDNVIYSYGSHFPIAVRLDDSKYIFNESKSTMTTNQHKGYVRMAIRESGGEIAGKRETKVVKEIVSRGIGSYEELMAVEIKRGSSNPCFGGNFVWEKKNPNCWPSF